MSNEVKKVRVMSAKMFLHRANSSKLSSIAFLAAHKEWLQTGEIAAITSPILAKVEAKEILPTPALAEVCQAVLGHMIASEIRKGEEAMAKGQAEKTPKNWTATILDAQGNTCVTVTEDGKEVILEKGFELNQDAQRWTDRKLYSGQSDWYGVVTHATMLVKGEPMMDTIIREHSIKRILAQPKGAITRKTGSKGGSFGVKAKQDVAHFSHG